MARSVKMECPDCGIKVEGKNLSRHYRKMHPDLDPNKRLKETRVERPKRSIKELPRSTIAGIIVALFTAAMLIIIALFAISFLQEGDSSLKGPREVWYTSGDGAIINGTFYQASTSGSVTIYLIHDIGQDRTVWDDYAKELQGEGYNVLAIDLRGHGESTINVKTPDITYDWTIMDHSDFLGILLDVQGAYRWVHETDEDGNENTDAGEYGAMIGVGKGGLFALSQAAKMSRERIVSAVIISPTLDCFELDVPQVFQDYGDVRPVMMAASEGDILADRAMDTILAQKEADGETNGIGVYVKGSKIGMPLLNDQDLKDRILDVLDQGWEI